MNEPTSQRRLLGRLLLGAGVLALPLTASITHAAQDVPAPPAPPEAPAAPQAPQAPQVKTVSRIVIVDNPGGKHGDDKDLHTRVIESNGHTIVLKTKEPLSDAEAQARAADAVKRLETIDTDHGQVAVFGAPGDHAGHSVVMVKRLGADGKDTAETGTERREVRTFVMRHDGAGADPSAMHGEAFAMTGCADGKPIEARSESTVDGKRQTSRVVICSKGGDKAQALAGLKKARERVANDASLSGEIRSEVLKQLDAEIARLGAEG